ncbi:HNH endonuclease [cf. Phormidesmis sp. LEGE 11477]|uniref:HNH endonuclease n=1 Tax=cf. Phormidesmis sp. LEGE 11477 TaxID=1828680 RepID=UPI001881A86C|nr:HNH endonuclease signature motif containing protein [cf. Phormidesmis sp. LEGE 11477]MBE9060745.1 HNH endonuclease [cf. Phormidesmis sp. LEGE 11477]
MSSTYIPTMLRKQVHERAIGYCEYCLVPEKLSLIPFSIDHIIAEKHGGLTKIDNLALSCSVCNQYKGSDIASIDPQTGKLCPFYNPRIDVWQEHFSLHSGSLLPLSARGRVTAKILRLNRAELIEERRLLIEANLLHPITGVNEE